MSVQHKIYLGVPGPRVCWGTVTGVVTSSSKHIVRPFNGGAGYSGVFDFNVLWTDAHNMYEAGEVTHFAMLHGDITPDPSQRWLDILLDVMERRGAALVSAVSPIKDGRGVTSSGICDPSQPWEAYRRFTQREILNDLPQEFDNTLAGYPDKPLLHNTGMWVCDLSYPVFQATNPDGSLKCLFRFPEQIVRDTDGKWKKYAESEDWLLSRELWEAGVKNTWITSEPRLTHHGKCDFPNWIQFGNFRHGDDNTAHHWRTDLDAKPLALTQILEFELGTKCNLGDQHGECPNMREDRYGDLDVSQEMDDATIVDAAVEAYTELGFTGLIGWIYYNEPLCQVGRMFRLMNEIKLKAPAARFILWTNGTLIPGECAHFLEFDQIVVSDYGEESRRGVERLKAKDVGCKVLKDAPFDRRLHQIEPVDKTTPCLRPFVELIFDTYGNSHLCCYDWQGKATFGNVMQEPFADIANRWRQQLPSIAGQAMNGEAPKFCVECGHRWDMYQKHDEAIVARAKHWREQQTKETETLQPCEHDG